MASFRSNPVHRTREVSWYPLPGRFLGKPGNVRRQAIRAKSPCLLFHSISCINPSPEPVKNNQDLISLKSSISSSNKPLCSHVLKDIILWIRFHNILFSYQLSIIVTENHPSTFIKILLAIIPVGIQILMSSSIIQLYTSCLINF